jgi:hypothetical protein
MVVALGAAVITVMTDKRLMSQLVQVSEDKKFLKLKIL